MAEAAQSSDPTCVELGPKSRPFIASRILVRFPIVCFVITLAVHVSIAGVTYYLYDSGVDVFAEDFEQLPLRLNSDTDRLRDLAFQNRNNYTGHVTRAIFSPYKPWWLRGYEVDRVELIYKSSENLLTAEKLRKIQLIEDSLAKDGNYSKKFCQLGYDQQCMKPLSLLRFFDGTYSHLNAAFVDKNFKNVSEVIFWAGYYNETKKRLMLLLGKDSRLSRSDVYSDVIRTRIPIGGPQTYNLGRDGERPLYENFLQNILQPELDAWKRYSSDVFEFYYMSDILFILNLKDQAYLDLYFAIGSLSFIFVYMLIHTESIWITIWGTFSITTSFLLVNLIYRFAFSYEYFGFFHILSIFIILGIGADDIFVFFDIWRLNCTKDFPSEAHRLSATFKRAFLSMLATSVTTMVAFLASAGSPLIPVSTFGIFSGLLVLMNFISVITFFPTVVLVYSLRILPFFHLCFTCDNLEGSGFEEYLQRKTRSQLYRDLSNGFTHTNGYVISQPIPQSTQHHSTWTEMDAKPETCGLSFVDRYCYMVSVYSSVSRRSSPKVTARIGYSKLMLFLTKFLSTTYFRLLTSKPAKVIVPVCFAGMFITFLVFAVGLKPDERQVQMFRDSNNFGQAQYLRAYGFAATTESELTKVRLVWGLKPRNMSGCNNKTSVECSGTPVFDDDFKFGSPETQQAILNVCRRLKSLTDDEVNALRIKRNLFTNETEIACFMDALQEFYTNEQDRTDIYGERVYPQNFNVKFPFTHQDMETLVKANADKVSDLKRIKVRRPFEAAMAFWLIGGMPPKATEDYYTYRGLIGEVKLNETQRIRNHEVLSFDTGIKYIAIEINTTMSAFTLSYQEGWPVRQRYEALMNDVLTSMPESLKDGFQVTHDTWHWLQIQKTLTDAAVYGIAIGLGLAFPILILATQNYVIGTLAALNITLVTVCVIGLIPIAGWRLGVLESLNLCLVVGLSVDYVVHLAEAYHRCEHHDRNERVRHMLETVGSAVLSGAITTGGAAFFMLFTEIQFLLEFGIFLISTIGFSLLFSMVGFPVVMAICGPQGDTGSIGALFRKLAGRKKSQSRSRRPTNSDTRSGSSENLSAANQNGGIPVAGNDNPVFLSDAVADDTEHGQHIEFDHLENSCQNSTQSDQISDRTSTDVENHTMLSGASAEGEEHGQDIELYRTENVRIEIQNSLHCDQISNKIAEVTDNGDIPQKSTSTDSGISANSQTSVNDVRLTTEM